MMGPPISGAVAAPILGALIEAEGWRAGFFALGLTSAVGGLVCVALMGRKKRDAPKKPADVRLTRPELMAIVRTRTFALLVGGMFLINVPQVLAASQIKLVVMSNGVSSQIATWMVSLYALGVILGRVIFGLALDRFRAHIVALLALSLPAIGYMVLAFPQPILWVVAGAILVIGVAQGAEGDIGAYMVSRHFDLKNYSLIFGFVRAGLDAGGAVGALVLSYSLAATGTYAPFMYVVTGSTLIGAFLFFLTGAGPTRARPLEPATPVQEGV
jgi:predicted MFS family arabinose efflux permease